MPKPLSPAALSVHVFGVYLLGAGLLLVTVPAVLLVPLALPLPQDVWIRIVGLLAMCLGATDVLAARTGAEAFYRLSVWRRGAASVLMLALVLLGLAPLALCVFAAVDATSALWTARALRAPQLQRAATA